MPIKTDFLPHKTYADEARCQLAVEKRFPNISLRYMITCTKDGRFTPIFFGSAAIQHAFEIANHGWAVVG